MWPPAICHFPCGSVDWNQYAHSSILPSRVTSLAEVWIEISTLGDKVRLSVVTSLAEVWIEISSSFTSSVIPECHFPCGSVDWNVHGLRRYHRVQGHFPCGSVDWNIATAPRTRPRTGHFPCGSVDWNTIGTRAVTNGVVTSLAEVWIEMYPVYDVITVNVRHFPCGSVDWNYRLVPVQSPYTGHFPCGSVDWNFPE